MESVYLPLLCIAVHKYALFLRVTMTPPSSNCHFFDNSGLKVPLNAFWRPRISYFSGKINFLRENVNKISQKLLTKWGERGIIFHNYLF